MVRREDGVIAVNIPGDDETKEEPRYVSPMELEAGEKKFHSYAEAEAAYKKKDEKKKSFCRRHWVCFSCLGVSAILSAILIPLLWFRMPQVSQSSKPSSSSSSSSSWLTCPFVD